MISVDPATFVITIPKADLPLVQSTPAEIRELNLNDFRLWLKDWEDGDGMLYTDTHRHNTEVVVGGLTLARVIEMLPPYSITFEDGQYAVNLTGANSNVGDKVNANQVSVRSANSAGLISSPEIQFATFGGRVTVNVDDGASGTIFPTGTPLRPVNNLDDALVIATYRGLSDIHILSALTIAATHNVAGMIVSADNWETVTVEAGAITDDTEFTKVELFGVMSGFWNVLNDCWVDTITNFCGWVRGGSIGSVGLADYTVESAGQSFFDDLVPLYPGTPSTIVMATDTAVSLTKCTDIVTIESLAVGASVTCGLLGGELSISASCTGGDVEVTGVGALLNQSALTVNSDGLVAGTHVQELWKMAGLAPDCPVTATKTRRFVGDTNTPAIDQTITGNGRTTSTITRI